MVNPVQTLTEPMDVVIAAAGSLSAAQNLGGRVVTGIFMPATWTAASLTFQASADNVTFVDMHVDGAEYVATADASIYIVLAADNWLGVNFLKVRSGTSATPVAQAAERTLTLMTGVPAKH